MFATYNALCATGVAVSSPVCSAHILNYYIDNDDNVSKWIHHLFVVDVVAAEKKKKMELHNNNCDTHTQNVQIS